MLSKIKLKTAGHKKLRNLLIFVAVIIFISSILFIPAINVLSIKNRKNLSERFYSAKGYNCGFIISYTHSVNKGRVHDYYRLAKKNQMELYQTQFVSYGAGIPESEETFGAVFSIKDDGYFISNLNRIIPLLTMAIGTIAEHSIVFGQKLGGDADELFFTDYFAPQTSVNLEMMRVSLAEYIFHKIY